MWVRSSLSCSLQTVDSPLFLSHPVRSLKAKQQNDADLRTQIQGVQERQGQVLCLRALAQERARVDEVHQVRRRHPIQVKPWRQGCPCGCCCTGCCCCTSSKAVVPAEEKDDSSRSTAGNSAARAANAQAHPHGKASTAAAGAAEATSTACTAATQPAGLTTCTRAAQQARATACAAQSSCTAATATALRKNTVGTSLFIYLVFSPIHLSLSFDLSRFIYCVHGKGVMVHGAHKKC